MTEIPSEADIQCSAEKIFDVIIDFRGQDRWLIRHSRALRAGRTQFRYYPDLCPDGRRGRKRA
jgi:hypothetical protein